MCYAPPWRALFRHLNSFKCSEADVPCTFWLRNVLRATTACNFSSLIRPDGSAPAALASLLFDPPEPQIIEKKVNCAFSTFSRACIFFLLTLSLLWSSLSFFSSLLWLFPPLLFHLSILSEVWLLNFLRSLLAIEIVLIIRGFTWLKVVWAEPFDVKSMIPPLIFHQCPIIPLYTHYLPSNVTNRLNVSSYDLANFKSNENPVFYWVHDVWCGGVLSE